MLAQTLDLGKISFSVLSFWYYHILFYTKCDYQIKKLRRSNSSLSKATAYDGTASALLTRQAAYSYPRKSIAMLLFIAPLLFPINLF